MKIEDLVQKEVRDLSCYEVKTILEQKSQEKIVKMNLNENFAMPTETIQELLLDACRSIDVRAYPPPRGSLAIKAISSFLGFSECEVSVANGADEIMDLLMKVFVRKGSKVIVVEPSFPMYTFFAQLYGGTKVTALLKPDFSLDVDAILNKMDKDTRLLFVCSPNNPTGNQFREANIKRLLQEFKGVVVVDEAYVDFASGSIIEWVRKYDNLAVLRSFSKSFGLAGLRLGYLVSNESIVNYVQRVVGPFNVNSVTQQTIALALQKWSYFEQQIRYVVDEREWLIQELKQIDGVTPYPSDANFILFKVTKPNLTSATVVERMENRNVLVKDRGHLPILENCIRVTVGTRNMNETFLSALKESLEE
ncbi:MAG TPA: histidinol-phosphate transaminase [Candidatus Bathyarchaeota archaeon]|nr:histidinol-phosphate transaminase [Candidatus Bathyarchaeota archaeon]